MKKILIIGDVMLDAYIEGSSDRISPEAPVPIVNVKRQFSSLGGAANVAMNIANLECQCMIYGFIGNDEEGLKIREQLDQYNIGDYCVIPNQEFVTTTKTRIISGNQQLLRIDKEKITSEDVDIDDGEIGELLRSGNVEIVIVSDYGKGVCSEQIMSALIKYQPQIKVLIDPKGSNWEKYRGAYLVKPNLKELSVIAGKEISNTDEDVFESGRKILKQFGFKYLLVTRGIKGMTLISETDVIHRKVEAIQVFDVSGAGDTVISVLSVMLNKKHEIKDAVGVANEAGRLVVSRPYTYAIKKHEFEEFINKVLKQLS